MKIGKYELFAVETGSFHLDGGAMFGVVPKPLWEPSHPSDDMNRIKLNARCLLLKSDSKKILIDTGVGSDWDDKFNRIYLIEHSDITLLNSLKNLGVSADEITDVILTHLHFDHTGGSTYLENGKWLPTFPNARYLVQKHHYEWSKKPSERDRASFIVNRYEPLREEGILHFTQGKEFFDDEIQFLPINGHTFSQQMVKISDSSQTLLYCGDLFPFSTHIPIPYVMGYDLQPLLTIEEKKTILSAAADNEWTLFFEHDPNSVAARIFKNDKGYMAKELLTKL